MAGEDMKAREFTVEAARVEDVDAIVALERATEDAPHWRRTSYAEMVRRVDLAADNDLKRHIAVAKQADGQIIGFAVVCAHPGLPDSAVLESLAVARAARRGGIGRALCEEIIAWCRSEGSEAIGLEVRRQSAGAIALYTSLGFVEAGLRPAYYSDSVDALVMRLELC